VNTTSKTVLFLIGATVFNILLMVIFVAAFIVLAGLILGSNASPVVFQIIIFVGFIASIVLTFLIYGWVMKRLQAKYNLEKHLPQLFKKKR
jgi:membrane protein implicated in regulation of membrane protease activity